MGLITVESQTSDSITKINYSNSASIHFFPQNTNINQTILRTCTQAIKFYEQTTHKIKACGWIIGKHTMRHKKYTLLQTLRLYFQTRNSC
jgi:hypothetical protein